MKAKFFCESVTRHATGSEQASLRPVHATCPENAEWSKWTPSGKLELVIDNPAAQGFLKPSHNYLVDITDYGPDAA